MRIIAVEEHFTCHDFLNRIDHATLVRNGWPAPGTPLLNGIAIAREFNERIARLTLAKPERFAAFAHLPMRCPSAAADELDVVTGDGRPLTYPLPWATSSSASHLLTADATRKTISQAGFRENSGIDTTDASIA